MNYFINVYLFTEMDEYDKVTPVRYNLDEEDLEALHKAIEGSQKLIPFGAVLHHVDDIIKLAFFKDSNSDMPFVEFELLNNNEK